MRRTCLLIFLMLAGKVCETEQVILHHRGEPSGIAAARHAHGSVFFQKLHSRMANGFTSGFSCSSFLQVAGHANEKTLKSLTPYPQQRRRRCERYLSSSPLLGNWLQPNKGKYKHFEHVKIDRIRAYYKSEEYDITEVAMDSLNSVEVSSEAVLIEGNVSPWWEQFPKRWVIVLLCFTAFLLCNMDRVSTFF